MTITEKKEPPYRSIAIAAQELSVPKHVIRFWEGKFSVIKPMKRTGGRRYYRMRDMELLKAIKYMLHEQGYSIKGLQKLIKDNDADSVIALAKEFHDNATQLPSQLIKQTSDIIYENSDGEDKPMSEINTTVSPEANIDITALITYIDDVLEMDKNFHAS